MGKSMHRVALLGLMAVVATTACGSDTKKNECPAGSENCACSGDGTCDDGLQCKENFCVKGDVCPEGTEGCVCHADDSCEAGTAGAVLVCTEGLCVPEGTDVGGLGDPCGEGLPICGLNEGTQLECTEGTCQMPPPVCTAGTLDCPCDAGSCGDGLECVAETCKAKTGSGLTVGNADVRACDVLLVLASADVNFAADVLGVTARDGDRLAVSFTAKADAALGSVGVVVDSLGAAVDTSGITPTKVECYDRTGKAVAAPELGFK